MFETTFKNKNTMSVYLKLSKNHDGDGKYNEYFGPLNIENESLDETNSYVMNDGYAVFYSHSNYRGIPGVFSSGENDHLSDDNYRSVPSEVNSSEIYDHTWKDSVNSIVLTNDSPINPWEILSFLLNQFSQYSGLNYLKDDVPGSEFYQMYYFDFSSQGCLYRFYYPTIYLDARSGNMNFEFNAANVTGGRNDTAKISFQMDLEGNFVGDVVSSYNCPPHQLPDWVINLTDDIIKIATPIVKAIVDLYVDIIIDVVTEGAGIEADEAVDKVINKCIDICAKVLTFFVDHLNQILGAIAKIKTGDGGLLYFPYMICHGMNDTVVGFFQEAGISGTIDNSYVFSLDKSKLPYSKYFPASSWNGDSCDFYLDNLEASAYTFWKPDFSMMYHNTGAICSFKMDGTNKNHLAVMMVFDPQGNLKSLQGSAYIHDCIDKDGYEVPNSGLVTNDENDAVEQFIGEGNERTANIADQDVLLDAYLFYMERAIRLSVKNAEGELDDNLGNMAMGSLLVIKAIRDEVLNSIVHEEPFVPPTPPPVDSLEVRFFKDNDYHNRQISFYGPDQQDNIHDDWNWPGTKNNISTDISSLVVGDGVYLTVYNEENCDDHNGAHYVFEPSSAAYDLRDVESPDIHNWNNEIKSFKITTEDPRV